MFTKPLVIDGERGNWCAIGPHQIVLTPAFTVALEGEVGIVGHDIAVNEFHAFLHERVGQRFQRLDGIVGALRALIVWKFAAGEIGIAMANERQVPIQPP